MGGWSKVGWYHVVGVDVIFFRVFFMLLLWQVVMFFFVCVFALLSDVKKPQLFLLLSISTFVEA